MHLYSSKLSSYRYFLTQKSHNGVIVNLEYVQDNPKQFIEDLGDNFEGVGGREVFREVERHTKTGEGFRRGERGGRVEGLEEFKEVRMEDFYFLRHVRGSSRSNL